MFYRCYIENDGENLDLVKKGSAYCDFFNTKGRLLGYLWHFSCIVLF